MVGILQRPAMWLGTFMIFLMLAGCAFAPRNELTAAQEQNRLLAEQSQAPWAQFWRFWQRPLCR